VTRRGREDWATAPATKTSIADTVISIRRIFWFLMGCDSFRFARLFSNYDRERNKRRYFGCCDLRAGLPVLAGRVREKRSAQALSAHRRVRALTEG